MVLDRTFFESLDVFSSEVDLLLKSPKSFLLASLMVEYPDHALRTGVRHVLCEQGSVARLSWMGLLSVVRQFITQVNVMALLETGRYSVPCCTRA